MQQTARPFLPEDPRPERSLIRAVVSRVIASRGEVEAPDVIRRTWPHDRLALAIAEARSTTTIATSSTWGEPVAGVATAAFVRSLAPRSAAAKLIEAGVKVDLGPGGTTSIPYVSTNVVPVFVTEGEPIPVVAPARGHNEIGPVKDLCAIISFTADLSKRSPQNIESIFSTMLREAAAASLDAAIFSAVAADASRPAGILYGVSATSSGGGVGLEGVAEDLASLMTAIEAAGGGANVWLFCSLSRSVKLKLLAGAGLSLPVVPVAGLADDTIVAVDVGAFASALSTDPEILITDQATLNMANPAAEIVSGTGPATASPVRDLFQTNSKAIRLILPCAWAMRAPGLVQQMSGVSW